MLTVETIRVLILYRDPLVRAGLMAILREHDQFALVCPEPPGAGMPGRPRDPYADVVVADYEHGLGAIAQTHLDTLPRQIRAPSVLILTQRDSEWEIRHALECGARGYLVLGCGLDELVDGVRTVHRGMRHISAHAARRLADSVASTSLTCRETDVLHLVAEGQGNKSIARQLDIAVGTVKSHLKAIFEKLDARSRTEVAAVAERRGLLALRTMGINDAVFARHASPCIEGRSPPTLASAVH